MNYPIAITCLESSTNYLFTLPDLPGCRIESVTIDAGMIELRKAMQSHLEILAEYGERIPTPTTIDKCRADNSSDDLIWAMIAFDITPYLGKSHKINVTLPELLIKQIDDRVSKSENYKTRSGFIAKACLAELEE